jgi:hypothetical protein
VEHGQGFNCNSSSQDRRPPFLSINPLRLDIPHLSPNPCTDRPYCSLLQGSSASSPQRQVVANKSVYSSEKDFQKTVILSPKARRDLSWIISLTPLQFFAPLWNLSPEACDLEVQTDASKIGYGIWFQGSLHQGHWDGTTTHLHINVLESTATWMIQGGRFFFRTEEVTFVQFIGPT